MEEQIDFSQSSNHNRSRPPPSSTGIPKQKLIVFYTITVCLSCLYLETQHFQPSIGDKKAYYMALLSWFDVFMCVWSYIQTIRIRNTPPTLSKLALERLQTQKFQDKFYLLTQKYCTICQNYKFPRVHHCSTCGSCQYKMDHHCIWTQTCIGYCNQKSFYLFCLYMSIGVFQFWYFTYRTIHQKTVPFLQMFEPGVIILWAFTAFSALFVGLMIVVLLSSHTVMMLTNYRTLDGMKQKRMCPPPLCQKGRSPNHLNLFDRGQVQNVKQFLGDKWYLWWAPLAREPQNELYPQPLAPHPDPSTLMRQTDLYEVELKYKSQMKQICNKNFLPYFAGKRMRINNSVFLLDCEQK